MQSPLEASVQELCTARLFEEFCTYGPKRPPYAADTVAIFSFVRSVFRVRTAADIPGILRPSPAETMLRTAFGRRLIYRHEEEVSRRIR